jgi:hypothetical protein
MKTCPFCVEEIQDEAVRCKHCHADLTGSAAKWQEFRRRYVAMSREEQVSAWNKLSSDQRETFAAVMAGKGLSSATATEKSNFLAFLLGLFLGPVGLWYKGHWVAGFAWLVMFAIMIPVSLFAAPIFWIGMAIHAGTAPARE